MSQPRTLDPTTPPLRHDSVRGIRLNRLIIGIGLIVVAIALSLLNGAGGSPHGGAPAPIVTHGPVLTRVQVVDLVRVRPEPLAATSVAVPIDVTISFHNDSTVTRVIDPTALRLSVSGAVVVGRPGGGHGLNRVALPPGRHVTVAIRFDHVLAAGATLEFRPAWGGGRELRWLLWQ